jgi:hypothetical protein
VVDDRLLLQRLAELELVFELISREIKMALVWQDVSAVRIDRLSVAVPGDTAILRPGAENTGVRVL